MTTRFCKHCQTEHPMDGFYIHTTKSGYVLIQCKKRVTQRYDAHREEVIRKVREYQRKNPEVIRRASANGNRKVSRERWHAYELVHREKLRLGLPSRGACTRCGRDPVRLYYHHPQGYDGASALITIPLCQRCHKAEDGYGPDARVRVRYEDAEGLKS